MAKQKFRYGDLVHIAKDLGPHMSHFPCDLEAIVIGSYHDQFGGGDTSSYTVFIKDQGENSWYDEHQLTLIKKKQYDLLKEWIDEIEKYIEEKSDLDWIFSHGKEVLKEGYEASIEALADCLELPDLAGGHGEYFIFWQNAQKLLAIAKPFLKKNDKDGWLAFCEQNKSA